MKPGGITWKVLAFLLASGLFFAFGEFLSKKFAQHPTFGMGASAIAIYAIGSLLWLPAIAQTNALVTTGMVWNVLSFIATAFIGTVLFGEMLSPMAIGGIAFGLLSIIFLSLA